MNIKQFRALLCYDLRYGFQSNRGKWLFALLVQVYFCTLAGRLSLITNTRIGFWERLTFLFRGLPEYHLSQTGTFELPVHWLIYHAFLLFLVGSYPIQELTQSGGQAFIRSSRREYWLLCKALWVCATVVGYYLMLASVLAVCSLLAGGSWAPPAAMTILFGIDMVELSFAEIALNWWGMPILVSVALCLTEVLLSLFIEPLLAFFVMLSYLVASVFWMSPVLIGNYSMLQRSSLLSGNTAISAQNCFAVCLSLIVFTSVLGTKLFQSKDILFSQEGQK